VNKDGSVYTYTIKEKAPAPAPVAAGFSWENTKSFFKDFFKSNIPPTSEKINLPFSPAVDLNGGIPERAKKFGMTEKMVQLLGDYGMRAQFTQEYNDKGSSNDRIDIR
jgi:hypothetical protein